MFFFYVLRFFKKGTQLKGGHYLWKYSKCLGKLHGFQVILKYLVEPFLRSLRLEGAYLREMLKHDSIEYNISLNIVPP